MPRNYKQFYAICRAHGLDKEELVLDYSHGATSSLKALEEAQFNDLLGYLMALNKPRRSTFAKATADKAPGSDQTTAGKAAPWSPPEGDKQRKKLLSIAYQMNWGNNAREVIPKLDQWARKQKFKKALMEHNPQELGVLVSVFENHVYPNYLKSLNK